MALPDTTTVVQDLPERLRPTVAPLVKHALGLAMGTVLAAFLVLLAVVAMLRDPNEALGVWLLGRNYLPGYGPWPSGALLGALWGFAIGFAAGWSIAACRNLFVSLWVALVAARERLRANRDFLDQI